VPLAFDEARRTGSRVFPELGESAKLELLSFAADQAEELEELHGKATVRPASKIAMMSTSRRGGDIAIAVDYCAGSGARRRRM
jgi:hypothetical protein